MKLGFPIRRDMLREDSVAGLVLGVQSVPDGLASGILAGVNPLAGLSVEPRRQGAESPGGVHGRAG